MVRMLILSLFMIILSACTGTSGKSTPVLIETPVQDLVSSTPILSPTGTAAALPTIDPAALTDSCLDEVEAGRIVEGWLSREGFDTLDDAWLAFQEKYGEDNLVSSTTDYNNEFAHAVTWQKMLLVGEFPFRVANEGVGYCAILVYQGGIGPEVGQGITDVKLAGEWSGYASGLVETQADTRAYLQERVGSVVTVRYMTAQNPQDVGFVRAGFFSPQMQRLWTESYYTFIPTDLNFLFERVGQPRGPSLREMMALASELGGYGVFLEYITDAIL